jgi:NADPH-dependent glutamate synthase beta subunit-like oxidoreductase
VGLPAHTPVPVPEYIRLIAAGRYADAYRVNWPSNVFPGVLGRTCDRPCEPACRRGRVEEAQTEKPGGMIRLSILRFRLPEEVIDDETNYVL